MADRYAVPFTLVAYVIAGLGWVLSGDPVRFAQVLVVASPCPLILAAPIAMVSGMSCNSRNGIIVKSGTTLEKLSDARTFAFDKTGTVTRGILKVATVLPQAGFSQDELLNRCQCRRPIDPYLGVLVDRRSASSRSAAGKRSQ